MSAFDQCREHGIRLKSYSTGDYRATCPKCSHMRKAIHRRIECLAITIKSDAVLWHCHHCGWEGGAKNEMQTEDRPRNRRHQSSRSLYR